MDSLYSPSSLLALVATMGLVPFVAVMTTSFVKLAIVFSILRNALGLNQIPPNMAIYGLAIILTVYIMAPVGFETKKIIEPYDLTTKDTGQLMKVVSEGAGPFKDFLKKHAEHTELKFFLSSAKKIWPEEESSKLELDSFFILVPAFMVTELSSAFEIGFLLYMPFLAIDLIISNLLLAMGMMMVSPMTISMPFKLLLFVLVEGWPKLIHGLVLTYQ